MRIVLHIRCIAERKCRQARGRKSVYTVCPFSIRSSAINFYLTFTKHLLPAVSVYFHAFTFPNLEYIPLIWFSGIVAWLTAHHEWMNTTEWPELGLRHLAAWHKHKSIKIITFIAIADFSLVFLFGTPELWMSNILVAYFYCTTFQNTSKQCIDEICILNSPHYLYGLWSVVCYCSFLSRAIFHGRRKRKTRRKKAETEPSILTRLCEMRLKKKCRKRVYNCWLFIEQCRQAQFRYIIYAYFYTQ